MIVGHTQQLALLERLIKTERVPHALLFSGPAHIGKQLVAQAFFWRLVTKQTYWDSFFSTNNATANALKKGVHPDILYIHKDEEKTKISIEQVRLLKRFVGLSRQELSHKGVIVDDAHLLSDAAYNSLLKTFEEPSGRTLVMLVTNQPHTLPKTIQSRAFEVPFQRVSNTAIREAFPRTTLTDDDLGWVAGRPGLVFLLEDEAEDTYVEALRRWFFAFTDSLSQEAISASFKKAEEIARQEDTSTPFEAWILAAHHAAKKDTAVLATHLRAVEHLATLRTKLTTRNVHARLQIEETFVRLKQ